MGFTDERDNAMTTDLRTCTAIWHAPDSDWDYPCNVLSLDPDDGRIHRYDDIHTHSRNGLTIEWVDDSVHPTVQARGETP